MAPFVDRIALRVIKGGEDLLDSEGAQELGPDGGNELPATAGEEPAGCAKVGGDMAHEVFTDRIGGVVAGRN